MYWQTSRFSLDVSTPKVMGIVNVTPDSFSDGGRFATGQEAMSQCEQLLRDGAHILDIGGESTRPGALALPLEDEMARVLPVLRHALTLGVPVSLDTYKPQLMRAALDMGVDIINDVWALRWKSDGDSLTGVDVVAQHPSCGVCLMHMHREPSTMQVAPMEGNVMAQVVSFLGKSADALRAKGVNASRICLDPGIGFGKTVVQNFSLLGQQRALLPLGYPVLAGWSRKSSLVAVTQDSLGSAATLNTRDRVVPSVVAAVLAVQNGASIVRVHDVRETVQALKVLAAANSNAADF
ncbi:dihydropteroate synthase [Rhodoferax aquaticus]|uniref:Dihydropteroate synthase n=1 Tax=Rhodoferax aquaticus TaxID=2527691 RepID=A0A515ENS6_9BURK|nr:dihydropteroate synthase [Rhodoferax aquaticus]QDL54327.1 dihydropteroate synthase [Rhodoferax aquaticus]